MERKKAIRKILLTRRDQLSTEKRASDSAVIRKELFSHPRFREAAVIYLYASYGSEVDTLALAQSCLDMGKSLFFPKVTGTGRMVFYPINFLSELKEGYGGIKEPPVSLKTEPYDEGHKPLMIMPLVGFDEKRNRLGYGGGFYDRYLAENPRFFTIALAFEEQCWQEGLPSESFDLSPQVILTPQRCLED